MPPKTSRRSKRKRGSTADEPPAPAGLESSSADKAANKKKKKEKPKRTAATTRTTTAAAASTISSDQLSLLSSLLQKLQALSSNKSRCTNALNALMEGRVACSILGFDPSMIKNTTPAADGTTKKKKNEGDDVGMGDASLTLAEAFSGDSAMASAATAASDSFEDPLLGGGSIPKRGGKKDKKKDTTAAAGLSSSGDGGAVDDSLGRNDAHLIMAVTQAINVILSSIKVEDATVFNNASPPHAAAAAAKKDDDDNSMNSDEDYTSEAIMLSALSSHLIIALMNNRTLFETITKASRGGGSSHSMSNNDTSFGMTSTLGSMMEVDEEFPSSRPSPTRGGGGGGTSSSASPQKDMKNAIMSHAKAVVGRALTSAVMGSLWSLETLGNGNILPSQVSASQLKDDDGSSSPEQTKVQQSTIRNAMWSSLLALETLFQLTPNPKLLMFSSVTSPFGAAISVDDILSTSTMGSGTNYNSRLWSGHAHSMMGAETIEMWNGILKRIMVGCQLGFTLEGSSLSGSNEGGDIYLFEVCQEVTDSMFTSEDNSKFVALVVNQFDEVDSISTSAPPPGKKARKSTSSRSKKSKQVPATDEVMAELSALLRERPENHIMFDCHVSVRRWAVLAFAWLCKGQKRLLETCMSLLSRDELWNDVMELPPYESKSALEAAYTSASKKKKKKKDTKKRPLSPSVDGQIEGVPGNLSLLVFVCCMIDMIYDAGSTAGMTPPSTGWMDEYVKAIMASPDPVASSVAAPASPPSATSKKTSGESSKAPARRSIRSRAATQKISAEKPAAKGSPRGSKRSPGGGKSVWVRPDIRKETAELAKHLVEAHTRVLQDAFLEMLRLSPPNAMRRLLVNVDPLEGSNEESTIRFYPFMHRTLETLGRAASTNSYFGSFEGKARVVATGSAVALSCFEQNFGRFKADTSSNVIVVDAKLLSFAVNEVFECLGNATATNSSESLEGYSIPDAVLVEYKLNEPLHMDSSSDFHLTESGEKSPSSQTFQSRAGRSSIESLAIFIRAHLSSETDSHRNGMDALLRSIFHITHLCYDRMKELDHATTSKSKQNKKKKPSFVNSTKQKYHNVSFLASDAVKTLGSCLSLCEQPKDASTNPLLCVRLLFRTFVSTQLVLDFVNLGDDLHGMIRSSLLNGAGKPSDVRWIRLFRAHIDLALIMGQGRSNHDCRADVSVIRDNESRLQVYRAISERNTPLCLSAFHHALISSTLCSSTNAESAEGALPAEEFLCNSFVNSVEKFLADFAIPASCSLVIGDDNLISFRDAQLFAMAFGKLPRNDQKKFLTKLTGILTKGLKVLKVSSLSADSSKVLARAVTLCSSLADIYSVPTLLPALSERIGSSHYDFPSIRPNPKGNFRGIFDWLTPSVPVPQAMGASQALEIKLVEKIQAMAEAGIATGFGTLTLDGCHLLLSSWNISTKLIGWSASSWSGVTEASAMQNMSMIQKLIALREDIFGVHSLVDVNEDPPVQETLLMRILRQKDAKSSLCEVLPAGLALADNMLKSASMQVEKKSSLSLQEFVYFDFLPIYVSFLVSKYTRPGKNAADALDRFHRANEHDALSDDSCCSDASVTRSNALERLHDACFALGAAPCYPDWLDADCKLADGISQNVAVDSAKQALRSLTQFGVQVFQRYFGAICKLEDGRTLSGKEVEKSKPSCVALQLIAPCDELILKVVVSFISRASSTDVSGCVQRINGVEGFEGWKANQGERRANGQWEIILLEALAQGSESKAVLDDYSLIGIRGGAREKHDAIKKDIDDVIRWRRALLGVLNALAPTCALLRFSITGKGRNEDPLSLGNSSSSSSGEPFYSSGINPASDEIKESLAFLSLISAYSANDTTMLQVCTACANQLMQEPSQFKRLISLSALRIRFEAIDDVLSDEGNCCSTIVDRSLTSDKSQDTLLTCFGVKLEKGRLIGFQSDVNFKSDVLSAGGGSSVFGVRQDNWNFIPEALMRVISSRSLKSTTRNHVVKVLIELMETKESFPNEVGSTLATAVDDLSTNRSAALSVLVEDICLLPKGHQNSEDMELSQNMARLVSYLVSIPGTSEGCKSILIEMLHKFDQWASSAPKHTIKLVCLLASRFGSLDEVGKTIVSLLQKATDDSELSGYVDCVKDFFAFLVSLDEIIKPAALGASSPIRDSGNMKQRVEKRATSLVAESRTCSFVETGEGFTEQHWYNCYTCGLLWDKGCCSLCARVCHQGHDVGYSRKSSFFCDCGAEVATAVEENRTPCKCLVPVNEETLKAVFAKTDVADGIASKDEGKEESGKSHDIFIELLAANFKSSCKQSLESLIKASKQSNWTASIISMLGSFYKDEPNSPQPKDYKELLLGCSLSSVSTTSSVIDLESRSGQPLQLRTQSKTSMVPLRAAKSNTVQPKVFSSGSSSSPIRKSRADMSAQMIVSDERGRLFIAESTSVLFCLAPVNVRHIQRSAISSHLTRSKLNILGSDKVKFSINGMALSPENNRHLLIWGASKAAVAIISSGLDSFERVIELKMQSEPAECDSDSEYLLKCEWVSHSELMVVVVCGTVVHVFDLKREKDNSCDATTHYALAYEDVLIRSATLLDRLPKLSSGVEYDDPIIETKLALLLDTGRLYFIDLIVDDDGNMEDQGENYIEVGAGVSFPTAGIRRYQGVEPAAKSSSSTTLGEGAHLSYLRQSNLLLYQCMSSCVVAFILDDDGSIISNFEILPNMIPAADLGGSYAVVGPYHHFEELGIVERGGESFHRFTCVGKSTRTSSQPVLILVEFNKSDVFVRELDWPTVTGLGIMSSYSYVGSCAYSCPHLVGGRGASDGYIDDATKIKERACLTLLTSSGSILTFGEDYAATTSLSLTRSQWSSSNSSSIQHNPDIHIFESLINVSEIDELVLGGDCVGKDPKAAKSKLSLNSTEYLACPSHDGCTLTARLQPKVGQKETKDLAIVAVRVLVGTMPDLIPSEVAIVGSGRSIKLKRNVKRWYDFPLTDEEILMAVRNGFVSIWISSCHDGNSSVIDCVEVYARKREQLPILTAASQIGVKAEELSCQKSVQSLATQSFRRELVPCVQSLTSLVKIVSGSNDALNSTSTNLDQASSIVKGVLERTALDQTCDERKEALILLSAAERDAAKRTNIEDESTVRGLLAQLQHLDKFFRAEYANEDEIKPHQEVVIERGMNMLSLIMNSTMKIVQKRGHNYRKIITKLIEEKSCESSIALVSKGIIDFVQTLEATHGAQPKLSSSVALNSRLILMEMACSNSDDFAQFKIIEEYFSLDSDIVKSCCAAMRSTITGGDNNDASKAIAPPSPEKEFTSEGYVTYQCDSCATFPITGTRYTLGGEMDIDLCKQCYDKGIAYSRTHDLNEAVEIDGRTLSIRGEDGDNEDMTCAKVWQMGVRVIEKSSLEQAEEAKRAGFLNNMTSQKTNVTSSINTDVATSVKQDEEIDVVSTEGFASSVFTHILLYISNTLTSQSEPTSMYVLQLAVDLVLNATTDELKASRGKEMVGALTKHLKGLIEGCPTDAEVPRNTCTKIVMTLRSLTSLVLARRDIMSRKFTLETKGKPSSRQKDKTDPRFICDVHGVPAVRRRCSHGVHKDRRFYVCGLERKHRCAYFKWSDDTTQSSTQNHEGMPLSLPVVQELQNAFAGGKLESAFCGLISSHYHSSQGDSAVNESQTNLINPFPSLITEEDRLRDKADGVYAVFEKFGRAPPASRSQDDFLDVADGTTELLLCESMDLFSHIAPKRKSSNALVWSMDWFSILCEIISGDSGATLRALAKKMLQRLCGFRSDIYHKVRDHYVFGFKYSKLLLQSRDILDAALLVREQARQCGRNWRDEEVTFQTLPASGLFGTEDLISEDCMKREECISSVLDELLSHAKRGENWKQFCGGLPEANLKRGSVDVSGFMLDMLQEIFSRPPIVSLMWLGSCLGGSNQVKVFGLIDIALENAEMGSKGVNIPRTDKEELMLYIGGDSNRTTPEQALARCMTIDDVNAFICQFVLSGRSDTLRAIASEIGIKLALQFNPSDRNRLFKSLVDNGMRRIGSLGQNSENYTSLLKLFIEGFGLDLDLHHAASTFSQAFTEQMAALNYFYEKKCDPNSDESDISKLDFDLSDCEHCHKEQLWTRLTKQDQVPSDDASDIQFLSEQMRPYQRGRLETSTASTCFSEFSSYYQLKFRVALSQVHINVSDPRGRLVKTIAVYFTPRQVSNGSSSDEENVNILKRDSYSRFWQKCGTINLSRGATEASLKLKHPVVAANLKITFEEFYERNNSARANSDGPVLYCPRCTRQVTNAHGVCGHCGEVAFQCRKCRHINYDRLDAFLCVECGYCTSGAFNFELTAGIAVNAVAIVDEEQFQTSMALLRVANKRKADTTKKVTALLSKHRKLDDDLNDLSLYGPHLRRALTGSLPKSFVGDDKTEVSISSKPVRSTSSSRSRLLNLARSLRQDGDSLRGSRGDFLRQVLSGGDDYMDDALLNALGGGSGGSSDPLSRLVANLQSRSNPSGGGEDAAEKGDKKAKLSPAEECRRLYMQKREAERESWELNRRIDSWNRLNNDALAAKVTSHGGGTYMTTDCSVCCSKVAYKNLSLLHAALKASISQSEHVVSSELVKLLLQESADLDPALKDLKRQVIITVASKSESASELVLNELQLRLSAIQDRTSAEILGQLVQMSFNRVEKFIELAVSVLES